MKQDVYDETQVKDDPELLELMLNDTKSASNLYKPTNYWSHYIEEFMPELRRLGLHDFRRRKNSILEKFGATDLFPSSSFLINTPPKNIILKWVQGILKFSLKMKKTPTVLNYIVRMYSGVTFDDINLLCYELSNAWGEKNGAKPLREFEGSKIGNPEYTFVIDNKLYTITLLYHYLQYAYCSKFLNFESIDSIMEIGSGSGKQIEVIKKLHPHLTFYVFDIPPQLYVCEQYLSKLFPKSVISYRKTRSMDTLPQGEGKIFILGNWKIAEISNLNYDLFWNSASFQEMEPEVVRNYLKFVNQQTKKSIFLHEMMAGQALATNPDKPGVLKKTTLEHYKKGLSNFQIQDLRKAIHLPNLSQPSYNYSFWTRK